MTYSVDNIQIEKGIHFTPGITGSKILSVNIDGTTTWVEQSKGPTGPQGATGPQGIKGVTGSNGLKKK